MSLVTIARVAVLSILLVAPNASSSSVVESVTPTIGPTGFDWNSRENHTHVQVDGTRTTQTVWWSDIRAPWMDVEVTGMDAGKLYRISHSESGDSFLANTTAYGVAVFWSLRAYTGTWTISPELSALVVSSFTVANPPPQLGTSRNIYTSQGPTWYDWCVYWGWCSYGGSGDDEDPDPPKPVTSHYEQGWVTQQAASSWSSDVTVTTTSCTSHTVKVDKWVSGGKAGIKGTAGASFSYDTQFCDTISSRGDRGTLQRQKNYFQKDAYDDGSYAIYETARGSAIWIQGAQLGPFSGGTSVSVDPGKTWSREVTEKGAGGVHMGGQLGGDAFGIGVGSNFWFNAGVETKVRISIQNAGATTKAYVINFVGGDDVSTGILGYGG